MILNISNLKFLWKYKRYMNLTFSQEGEDVIFSKFVDFKEKGFYVDIGAHHPMRFSNTCRLYLNGWRGMNVDAMPGAMNPFVKYRKEDINLSYGVGTVEEDKEFYIFEEPALNTFDGKLAKIREREGYKIIDKKVVSIRRLETLFKEYLAEDQTIDLLTLDIEGMELEALKSNDWTKWKPRFVMCEVLFRGDIVELLERDTVRFLMKNNYVIQSILDNTILFRLK